jgi:hypothetical protein
VVPEHDVRRLRELLEQAAEERLAAPARDEVTGDADEIWPAGHNPVDGTTARALAERRQPEVEVGQMRDPQAVELPRQAVDRQVERAQPNPAGFERAVRDDERRNRDDDPEEDQISSFSRTGFTETT